MEIEYTDEQRRLIEQVRRFPGVRLETGVRCRAVKPCGPEVHNLHMTECHGLPVRHEGPHSWEL